VFEAWARRCRQVEIVSDTPSNSYVFHRTVQSGTFIGHSQGAATAGIPPPCPSDCIATMVPVMRTLSPPVVTGDGSSNGEGRHAPERDALRLEFKVPSKALPRAGFDPRRYRPLGQFARPERFLLTKKFCAVSRRGYNAAVKSLPGADTPPEPPARNRRTAPDGCKNSLPV